MTVAARALQFISFPKDNGQNGLMIETYHVDPNAGLRVTDRYLSTLPPKRSDTFLA